MVQRFNCHPTIHDEFMVEEEGGRYVYAEDYDNMRKLLRNCAHNLLEYAVYTRDQIDELDTAVQELHDATEES